MSEPLTSAAADDAPVVAHVAASDIDWCAREMLAQLLESGAVPFSQVLLSYTTRSSPQLGSGRVRRVHAPSRLPVLRTLALRRQIAEIVLDSGARRVILHAWSRAAVRWCAPLIDDDHRLVIDVPGAARAKDVVVWPTTGRWRQLPTYVCDDAPAVRTLVSAGVPASKCPIVTPVLSWQTPSPERVQALRAALRLDPAARVVVILPPLTRASCAFEAAWACILVHQVVPNLRVLIARGTPEAARIERLLRSVRHEAMACYAPADTPLGELVALADVAAYTPRASAVVPAFAAAVAAGLLVVTTAPRLADHSQVITCRPSSVRDIARAILKALDRAASSCDRPPPLDSAACSDNGHVAAAYAAVYAHLSDDWRGERNLTADGARATDARVRPAASAE